MSTSWTPLPFSFIPASQVLTAAIVLPIVCSVVVFLRIYTRKIQKQALKTDDWLMVPALFLMIGMSACMITGYAIKVMGYPTPLPYGTDPQLAAHMFLESYEKTAKIEFAFQICQGLSMAFAKLSVILFCRRIFIVHDGSAMDWTTRVLIVVNVCWILGFTLTEIFGCKLKVWLHWSPLETDLINKECGDLRKPLLAYVISDFCLELMLLILPLPSIWGLQVSLGKKLWITGVFMLGLMSVIGSLIRMAFYIIVLRLPYDAGYDVDQTVTTMLWWSMLQSGLAIIAACLPTIYALRKHIKADSFASIGGNWVGSLSWLRTSEKSMSEVKQPDSRNNSDSVAQAQPGGMMELREVCFSDDGKVLLKDEIRLTTV